VSDGTLFDVPATNDDPDMERRRARARRDTGMARAEGAADPDWKDKARRALRTYLETHQEFHVDDFWESTGLERPAEARALGPLVQRAARRGWMHKSGRYRASSASNLSEKPIWTSDIYQGEGT